MVHLCGCDCSFLRMQIAICDSHNVTHSYRYVLDERSRSLRAAVDPQFGGDNVVGGAAQSQDYLEWLASYGHHEISASEADFEVHRPLLRVDDAETNPRLLLLATGQLVLGSQPVPDRETMLAVESHETSPQVASVLFRASPTGNGGVDRWLSEESDPADDDKFDAMRLRAGWHNTDRTTFGEQRLSVEGWNGDEGWREVIAIRADGNVGIGTANPKAALHVVGSSYTEGVLAFGGQGDQIRSCASDGCAFDFECPSEAFCFHPDNAGPSRDSVCCFELNADGTACKADRACPDGSDGHLPDKCCENIDGKYDVFDHADGLPRRERRRFKAWVIPDRNLNISRVADRPAGSIVDDRYGRFRAAQEFVVASTGTFRLARRSSAEHLIATKALRLHSYGLDSHCR